MTTTFGPDYDEKLDGERLSKQNDRIRDYMLARDCYRSLSEIARALEYPESSVSAQLRHLRKEEFGGYAVIKRRRAGSPGTWEYRVVRPGELALEEPN
jgi:hypothetical protein